jgi:hypothetical protein
VAHLTAEKKEISPLILAGGKVTQACLSLLIKTAKNLQNFDETMLHTV